MVKFEDVKSNVPDRTPVSTIDSIQKMIEQSTAATTKAFVSQMAKQVFASTPFHNLTSDKNSIGVLSPTTTQLGQAAAELAPRLAEIFGGTAAEWEESIVRRATDYKNPTLAAMSDIPIYGRFLVTRKNFQGVLSGWTG